MTTKKLQLSADTSSLILLKKADLLKKYANFFACYVSNHVYFELNRTGAFNPEIELIIHEMDSVCTADKSVITVYQQKKLDAVLSDDAQILKTCKQLDYEHYCCLSLSAILAVRKYITKRQALEDMEELLKFGRYSTWVQNYAFHMLD